MDNSNGENFAAMLDQFDGVGSLDLAIGDKVNAKVVHITKDNIFCELSQTQEACIPLEEFLDDQGNLSTSVGSTIEAFVVRLDDTIELSRRVGRDHIDLAMLESAQQSQMPIEGNVTGVNKGGLEVSIGGARGFCPIGQADIKYVEDPQEFIGKTLLFSIKQVKEGGRNVILNRRDLLEAERKEKVKLLMDNLSQGQRIKGTVSRIAAFGAFVDLGGVDGLIPISELSYGRVKSVEDILSEGDEITVEILSIEDNPKRPGESRIALSLKATMPEPFEAHADLLKEGLTLEGVVVRIEKFGVFVELAPGLQGLVHISEMSFERVRHPSDIVKEGETVTVRILGVDKEQQRISLSLKEASAVEKSEDKVVPSIKYEEGMSVQGVVKRIERYGVFLALEGGQTALLPAVETGTHRGTDLSKVFPIETKMLVKIIAIDDRGIRVSKTAQDELEERTQINEYQKTQPRGSFGTLGDLLKKRL